VGHQLNRALRDRARHYVTVASGSEPRADWRRPQGKIKLLGNDQLEIPLWDDIGILTVDPDYLREVLGIDDEELIVDLVEWGLAYDFGPPDVQPDAYRQAEASIADRLRAALTGRFEVVSGLS